MLRQPTLDLLHELRLAGMAQAFQEQTAMPDLGELSFEDRLSLLLEREKTDREQRRYQRLKGHAKLHLDATIEDLNFKAPRGLDRSLVLRLASGQWISDGQTVLVTGATGSGKSYLACALGHQACRNGISTRYYRLSRLLDELTLARGDGSYPKLVQRLARTWLLILDDWGLASLSGQGRHDLLEILDDRYARRGTLLASQVPLEHWHDVVGDPTFADAILDRPQQRTQDHPQGRFHEEALRLDQGWLHALTSTLNHDPPARYGPPLLQGDRHESESAIGLSESVVGIVGIRSEADVFGHPSTEASSLCRPAAQAAVALVKVHPLRTAFLILPLIFDSNSRLFLWCF